MKTFMTTVILGATMAMAGSEMPLWNGDMLGPVNVDPVAVKSTEKPNLERLTDVAEPTLKLYLLEDQSEAAPFVIVCPGGGYNVLAYTKEGTEIAEWLNSIGVSAAVLKYRVPKNREGALEDARQAVRMAREKSAAWSIDPTRIGMLGFSAGGHLTAACSNSDVRPDFSVLVYPAYLFKKGSTELVDEIQVDEKTPPAFIVQTKDDKAYYRSTIAYTAALDAAGVDVESHLFAKGGHGYGMRDRGHPVSQWPRLCEAWLREMKILK